nr:MAG TPA: hypothetical protein [Caudoviricetes sp.]
MLFILSSMYLLTITKGHQVLVMYIPSMTSILISSIYRLNARLRHDLYLPLYSP